MVNLTVQDLIGLNVRIQQHFQMRAGIEKHGLLSSIVERPDQTYADKTMYPDSFTKAASIFEALARWHVFSDLNKRTALIATRMYLDINDYFFFVPISAVRFSVKIADSQNTDDEYTQKLILKISKWIRKYSARKESIQEITKAVKNNTRELRLISTLRRFGLRSLARRLENKWLAMDIYPEYRLSEPEVVAFIQAMLVQTRTEVEALIARWEKEKENA